MTQPSHCSDPLATFLKSLQGPLKTTNISMLIQGSGVPSTCWASQMFLLTVSGHFVHCVEEWSSYGSPVFKKTREKSLSRSSIFHTWWKQRRPHLLNPPPPLSWRLGLLHLDQDVLLVGEVDHPPCERTSHLELQESIVPKICQVHCCGTWTVKGKLSVWKCAFVRTCTGHRTP